MDCKPDLGTQSVSGIDEDTRSVHSQSVAEDGTVRIVPTEFFASPPFDWAVRYPVARSGAEQYVGSPLLIGRRLQSGFYPVVYPYTVPV